MHREATNIGCELSIDKKLYIQCSNSGFLCVSYTATSTIVSSQKRAAEKAVRAEEKLVQHVARGEA